MDVLIKVLITLGFLGKMVNLIQSMYRDTKSKFYLGDMETSWVQLERGVCSHFFFLACSEKS